MAVREGPLKQMTESGNCKWPTAIFGHSKCTMDACTCKCHQEKKEQ